jgi:CRISPR-associated protein Cas2
MHPILEQTKPIDIIIAYDIADPRRLRRTARQLEKVAIRIQYSVFLWPSVSRQQIEHLVRMLRQWIDLEEDDVRIYRIDPKRSLHLGDALDLNHPTLFG